jgi:N-acyl-D-aspartate/D-glutamate deacylase
MVRETGLMTLEEIHHKLSAVPAKVLGLHQRGTIAEGQAADIIVYDYDRLGFEKLRYEIVADLPDGDWRRVCKPQGIERVIVNGVTTFVDGVDCTGALPGRVVGSGGPEVDAWLRDPAALAAE